jgi:hypothetical protein
MGFAVLRRNDIVMDLVAVVSKALVRLPISGPECVSSYDFILVSLRNFYARHSQ